MEFFAEQYGEYLPRVLNYVRLRVDSEDLAQDLTAQTFERALSRLHTLRDRGAFGGWLFRIARSVVAGHYRRRRRILPLESLENRRADELELGLTLTQPQPEAEVERGLEMAALRQALTLLSEREQEIIRLRFVAGLTNRAIGRAMGLREGNVAVILFRALRKLRKTLGEGGFGREVGPASPR
jgi:RNA polymerase sigma-70 factor (ECF subfamily)